MTRTQLYLPESQYEELKKMAAAQNKTFAALIRNLLEEKMVEIKTGKKDKQQKNAAILLLDSLGAIQRLKEKGIQRDGSIHHDRYLYG